MLITAKTNINKKKKTPAALEGNISKKHSMDEFCIIVCWVTRHYESNFNVTLHSNPF